LDKLVASDGREDDETAQVQAMQAQVTATPTPLGNAAAPPPAAPGSTAGIAGGTVSAAQGIALVNKTHFVAPLSGEVTIWREGTDPETGHQCAIPVTERSLKLEFAPFLVSVSTAAGTRSMALASVWLNSSYRRAYPGGVVLQPEGATPPGCYNLWSGFAVTPMPGNSGPMIDHVYMLCDGAREQAEYVLDWLALCVQRPGSRPEVALVLRGGRGTGKGTVFRVMLTIFGRHGLHITQPKHLVGNFNSHLRYALFLFADEAHWPGDRSAEGVLKALITEPTVAIEMKGHDVFTAPNRIKLAMASNNEWVVPAGADERRYCVIDVSNARAQDHTYFAALNAWIDANGAAIFLDHLLQRDLSNFNARAVPKTAALDRQKIEGMPALDRWIMEALDTAQGLDGQEWTESPQSVPCSAATLGFEAYCKRVGARSTRADTRTIGARLATVFGCGPAVVVASGNKPNDRQRRWVVPALTTARVRAAATFGLDKYVWGTV